jgi:hypothetical protein
MASVFRLLVFVAIATFFAHGVYAGLRSGQFPMGGRFGPSYQITRKKNAVHFWVVVSAMSTVVLATAWLAARSLLWQ